MTIGERIKQRRIELGFDANELASKIGKSRATVYRYENGDIENMPTTVLEPIAKALNTTPAYLMGWSNNPEYSPLKLSKEAKDFFQKTDAFDAELKVLGWSYEYFGCYWWYEYNELGLRPNNEGELIEDGTGTLIGCNDKKCINCSEREQYYLFTNGKVSFKVSPEDYDSFINDSQAFFKERLQQLLKKSMKQLFLEKDNQPLLNAAHTRTDIPESDKTDDLRQQEEDIMDDPDF